MSSHCLFIHELWPESPMGKLRKAVLTGGPSAVFRIKKVPHWSIREQAGSRLKQIN